MFSNLPANVNKPQKLSSKTVINRLNIPVKEISVNRRSFICTSALVAAAVALAPATLFGGKRYVLYGDGVHDDTQALQAWFDGKIVYWPDGSIASILKNSPDNPFKVGAGRVFNLRQTIYIERGAYA